MINKKSKKNNSYKLKKSVFLIAIILIVTALVVILFYSLKNSTTNTDNKPVSSTTAIESSQEVSSSSSKTEVKTTKTVPILMYHSIATEPGNILRIPKDRFDEQMKWLKDNGYSTITLDEAYKAVNEKNQIPEKSVVITFDDGYIDNYENAFPVLKKYDFCGTVFMITGKIGDKANGYLTADMLKEMDNSVLKIEAHTVDHKNLDSLSYQKQIVELKDSKKTLEDLLNKKVEYLAFPSGKYNTNTIKAAKETGYKMCFKMNGGQGTINDEIYEFPRFFVGEDMGEFKERIEGTFNYTK